MLLPPEGGGWEGVLGRHEPLRAPTLTLPLRGREPDTEPS
ncbi:hypothetical protein GEOBRER4_n1157 [Citrifermentans bremense]|uniref:Uncharacterized protein n=1 Tax=Citrifermentans bremense TaxID=60035 RepID=A0A7R7FT80_9BACT|nr:hypothetical protein GEOBRER4_n1157 [Citrifermentans bremense]